MTRTATAPTNLTPRDRLIVELVFGLGGCGIEHVHLRLWQSGTNRRACYRRVQTLVAGRYLHEQRLPSLTGKGSGKALLTLGPRGRALLSEQADLDQLRRLRGRRSINPWWANHHFHICTFRVMLELAALARDDVAFRSWVSEATFKHRPIRVRDTTPTEGSSAARTITVVPDGGFTLVHTDREQHAYFEMDLSTVPPKRMALRIRGYLLHAMGAQRPIPVFIVVPDQKRQALLTDICTREAGALKTNATLFWITTWDQLASDTILCAPIWLQTGVEDPQAIIPSPSQGPLPWCRERPQRTADRPTWRASR